MRAEWKHRLIGAPVVLGCLAALGGWWIWPTWTSQAPSEFPRALRQYHTALAAVADVAPAGSFVHMGHRAGSFEEFAKDLHGGVPSNPKPVAVLMDRAFDQLGLISIEVDVRRSPLNDHDVVVVHDAVDGAQLDTAGRAYAERNTVRRLVEQFLKDERHRQGKRIAFEIKAPRVDLDEATRESVDRIARTLNALLGKRPDETLARAAIDLLSFNPTVLTRLHQALGAGARGHGLYQIVTSNQYPEWLYRLGPQPPLSERVRAKLRSIPWLRGVVFDPKYVNGFATLFNGINAARQARGLPLLELHLSTMSHDLPALVERLKAEPEPLQNVHGLMYQIRKP